MKIGKRLITILLTAALTVTLIPSAAYADDPLAGNTYDVGSEAALAALMGVWADGDTVRLTGDVTYLAGIFISGNNITFNLNGFDLNVINESGTALEVYGGGSVKLTGEGKLNVSGKGDNASGVSVDGSSSAVVSNATADGYRCSSVLSAGGTICVTGNVYASGECCSGARSESGDITVNGDVVVSGDWSEGVWAYTTSIGSPSSIQIDGNTTASGYECCGAHSDGEDSTITIENVKADGERCKGAYAGNGGTVTVNGNAEAEGLSSCSAYAESENSQVIVRQSAIGDGIQSYGAYASQDGEVTVENDAKATGNSCTGAYAEGGTVKVGGNAVADGDDTSTAAYAKSGGQLTVTGSAIAQGQYCHGASSYDTDCFVNIVLNVSVDGEGCIGAIAGYHGTTSVGGNIEASGTDGIGASASDDGTITVEGAVTVPNYHEYVSLEYENIRSKDDGVRGTSPYEDYIIYRISGSNSEIRVRFHLTLKITTSELPAATATKAYSQKIAVNYNGGKTLTYSALGLPSGLSINTGTGVISGTPAAGSDTASPYSVTIEVTDGTISDSRMYSLIVKATAATPVIGTQPSSISIIAGKTATFTVEATVSDGGTLSYQWQKSGFMGWSNIFRATGASYSASVAAVDNGKKYRCVVTNSKNGDSKSINSDVAILTVLAAAVTPTISTQPQDTAKLVGRTATFTVTASASDGGPLSYQWRRSESGSSTWNDIPGALNADYTTGTLTAVDDGSKYLCIVTNNKNGDKKSINSNVATLTVLAAAVTPTINTQPLDITRLVGETAVFTVSASAIDSGTLSYQWQRCASGSSVYQDVTGETSMGLTTGALTIADNGSKYICVVTNSLNETTKSAISNEATLTVLTPAAAPTINTQPQDITKLVGETASFTVSASAIDSGTLSYQWQRCASGSSIWMDVTGETNASYTTGALTIADNGSKYLCVVTNSLNGTSKSAISNAAALTVNLPDSGSGSGGNKNHKQTASIQTDGTTINLPVRIDKENAKAIMDIVADDLESAFSMIEEGSGGLKTIDIEVPEIKGINQYALELPASVLDSDEITRKIEMKTDIGTITLQDNMLSGVETSKTEKVEISIGRGDKSDLPTELQEKIGSRPMVELKLTAGDKTVEWNNPDSPVTVSIPYIPTAEELKDPEHIVVWYIDGKGNAVEVPSGRYDAKTGMVVFSATHFSNYAIAFVHKTFEDLGTVSWAEKPIGILASKGILEGLTEDKYDPKLKITRGDFLCFLIRTLNINASFDENFDDISKNSYYYSEIGAAKKLGITAGTGNNLFRPDTGISRQDMMVLTVRTLELLNMAEKEDTASSLNQFSDKSFIAAYALDSIAFLAREGLIAGNRGKLNPRGDTTRAEAAVFLYRIYGKYSGLVHSL